MIPKLDRSVSLFRTLSHAHHLLNECQTSSRAAHTNQYTHTDNGPKKQTETDSTTVSDTDMVTNSHHQRSQVKHTTATTTSKKMNMYIYFLSHDTTTINDGTIETTFINGTDKPQQFIALISDELSDSHFTSRRSQNLRFKSIENRVTMMENNTRRTTFDVL